MIRPAARDGGVRPSVTLPDGPIWYNQSNGMGLYDPTQFGSVAYDPLYGNGDVVFFGGSNAGSSFTNNTWIYDGFGWTNISADLSLSPPGMLGGAMDYDPAWGGVILATGLTADGYLSGTWLFTATGWTNETATVNATGTDEPYSYDGTLAWDPGRQALIYVDGCFEAACSLEYTGTWELTSTWSYLFLGPDNATLGLVHAAMAYDALDQEMVVFGGYFNGADSNQTFVLNDTAGYWNDITATATGCFLSDCYYPTARSYAAITWDGQQDAIMMFGGYNDSSAVTYNDTWYFGDNEWFPANFFYSFNGPPTIATAIMPVNSTDIAPLLIGGGLLSLDIYSPWSYVFEYPTVLNITTIVHNPTDAGTDVSVTVNVQADSGSGGWVEWGISSQGNGASGPEYGLTSASPSWNFSGTDFTYSTPGSYQVNATLDDYFYIYGYAYSNVTVVSPVTLSIGATPTTTEVGGSVTFTSTPAAGVTPYTYSWTFGDGATSTVLAPSHSYAESGTFETNLTVQDSGGGSALAHTNVTVLPALVAHSSANVTTTDLGLPVAFTGSAVGGSGIYSTYAWKFGDGTTASTASPTHTFTTAGTYQVVLNVTDSLGFLSTNTITVVVNPALAGAAISSSPSSPSTGATVTFGETPTGGTTPYTYSWDFGDGTTGSGATPTHSYSTSGTFTVKVIVADALGVKVTETLTVTVSASSSSSPFSLTSGTGLYILLGVVIVVVVVVALALTMRRRGPSSSGAPPTGSGGAPPSGAGGPPPPSS